MRKPLPHLAAAVVAIGCSALPATAAPTPTSFIDAAQFQVAQPGSVTTLGDMDGEHLAQTLTVQIGGTALGVFLPVYCTTGTLLVWLRDASAGLDGPVIASGRMYPSRSWPSAGQVAEVPFSPAVPVAQGAQLEIEIAAKGDCVFFFAPAGTDYPGGHGYYEYMGTFVQPWGPLGPSSGIDGDDLPFQLRLQP